VACEKGVGVMGMKRERAAFGVWGGPRDLGVGGCGSPPLLLECTYIAPYVELYIQTEGGCVQLRCIRACLDYFTAYELIVTACAQGVEFPRALVSRMPLNRCDVEHTP